MRLPRVRFTVRRMMVAVALVALAMGAAARYYRPLPTRLYYVGDILHARAKRGAGGPGAVDLTPMIQAIAAVAPGTWEGGERQHRPAVSPYFLTLSVAVRHSERVHRLVLERL